MQKFKIKSYIAFMSLGTEECGVRGCIYLRARFCFSYRVWGCGCYLYFSTLFKIRHSLNIWVRVGGKGVSMPTGTVCNFALNTSATTALLSQHLLTLYHYRDTCTPIHINITCPQHIFLYIWQTLHS